MILNAGKKCSKLLPVYLMTAIMVIFAISAEASWSEQSNRDISSGWYFVPINHTVDCLVEDTTAIGKAFKFSNSPLFRVFTLAGTIAIASHPAGVKSKPMENDNVPSAKSNILLKLRI
jgi:hypothetical protein